MKRLLSFYGDDFTGSTDAMEALACHGVDTVLFTRLPSEEEFAPFKDHAAIGLAGVSRSQTPEWMDENLPDVFTWLKNLGADFCHYKVCSTFDSSPGIGSIGRAIDVGLRVFGQKRCSLIVGAPQLKRFTFAGHLFAAYQGKVYRIDRHPVMSVHPVTPMHESDVLVHLAQQSSAGVDLLDVHDGVTQLAAGQALLKLPSESLPFVAGSSGVEYALMAAKGLRRDARFDALPPVDRLLVISGSVSPTSARQIQQAGGNGFALIAADAVELAQGRADGVLAQARDLLAEGMSPLIHSALGPFSDQGGALAQISGGRETLSKTLGRVARILVEQFKLRRLVIAGGDTSSHALSELDIFALKTRFPLADAPGSPMCTAFSKNSHLSGLEISLKGGQLGGDDYFSRLRDGL